MINKCGECNNYLHIIIIIILIIIIIMIIKVIKKGCQETIENTEVIINLKTTCK